MSNAETEKVIAVEHWTERLFSFTTTRRAALRFRSGEFVMIGLANENESAKPILRAYSIASPFWAEQLEFYSIKVADGPLTAKLQLIQPGDEIIVKPKAVGSLVLDALLPGKRLYLLATGTGFAPFAALLRDPESYERFEQIILTHTCRAVAELAYSQKIISSLSQDPLLSQVLPADKLSSALRYYPTTTREPSATVGRITTLIEDGRLFADLQLPELDPAADRVMVCGSLAFNVSLQTMLNQRGLRQGSNSRPGDYVIERAFVG